MRPAETIEKLIKRLETKASVELDERVHSEISKALVESERTKSAKVEPKIWRIIMKSRITKLAAAAVVIIVVLVGIHHFGGSIDGASVAWAELVERVERSHDEYMKELLLAVEEKDTERIEFYADLLSEFWQNLGWLATELHPESQYRIFGRFSGQKGGESDQIGIQIFLEYSDQFSDWLGKIEDEAWINEIIHVIKEMEEYSEEIRDVGRDRGLDFSYAEHCLPSFVTYCEWFEQLPWDNPEQDMMPGSVLMAIERDLKIARREIDALERRDADRVAKRCMQQAQKNVQDMSRKIRSGQMVNQWKLCGQLNQKISELSGLTLYLAIASGDVTQTNKLHDPEKIHQILTGEFVNEQSFADYFVEQVDQALDLCEQLSAELESTR